MTSSVNLPRLNRILADLLFLLDLNFQIDLPFLYPSRYLDLQMFEQRLDEVLTQLRPRALHWQIILALSFMLTLIGAFHWLTDPETYEVSCLSSFWNHKFFTANCLILIGLFAIGGIHRRIFAPSIITGRVREVIAQFNMSCDERGKLILMPHPSYHHHVVVPQNQRNNNHNHRS